MCMGVLSVDETRIDYSGGAEDLPGEETRDPVEEADVQAQLDKAHRLNGWIFSTNISAFDDDGTHVAGLKQDKEGNVVLHNPKQTLRELQPLDEGMKRLLSWLAERILYRRDRMRTG